LNWAKRNKEHLRQYGIEYRYKTRLKALQKISGLEKPKCVYCGCDVFEVLEINHVNLDGRKESRRTNWNGYGLVLAILRGDREIGDLEIVCKVCNQAHYCEKKHGVVFKVIFRTRTSSAGQTETMTSGKLIS